MIFFSILAEPGRCVKSLPQGGSYCVPDMKIHPQGEKKRMIPKTLRLSAGGKIFCGDGDHSFRWLYSSQNRQKSLAAWERGRSDAQNREVSAR